MKNLMKLFVAVIAMTIATGSLAQEYGIKVGLNLANQLAKDDNETYSDDFAMKPGFHLGVTAEFPVTEMIYFETGLIFSQKGYKYDGDFGDFTVNLNYLEIPLMGKALFDLGDLMVYGQLGPYIGLGLTGKYKNDDDEDIDWGSDDDDDYKRLDFGLNIGAGIQINNITIGASYGLGLMNISPIDRGGFQINNRVIGVSLGYKL